MRHDLTSLELFVTVAECGNLTHAAQRQHLAVSAVSKRIGELEALAGTPLLLRHPRGVMLTPAGQSLLHHARQMLQLVRRMDEELQEYAGGMRGHIRLHAVASALTQHLPSELESFLARYPDMQISLEERTGKAIVRAVADGSADMGIVASKVSSTGLSTRPYRSDCLMLGVPQGHPLAGYEAVRFGEALAYPFVGPHAESSLAVLMAEGAQACGRMLQQRVQVSSFDAMCRLVETRLGITLLPEGVLAPHVAAGRIHGVALQEDWAVRQLSIVFREPGGLSAITHELIEHLQFAAAVRT